MSGVFNLRVYGILMKEGRVLVSDEYHHGMYITKFPGGGLQFGEGTLDCLRREMMEETGMEVEIVRHFYTTDFFQRSAFKEASQVISIYYIMRSENVEKIKVSAIPFDFVSPAEDAQSFRWLSVSEIKKEDFTFPIDQKVGEMLAAYGNDS